MSYAVHSAKPPFDESTLNPGEKIYQVGNKWVVTDQGKPDQAGADAVLDRAASQTENSMKRSAALDVLVREQLTERAKDADAPAAIKEYAEAVAATVDEAVVIKVRGG